VLVFHAREREFALGTDVEKPQEARDLVDGLVRDLKDTGVNVRGEIVSEPARSDGASDP